MAMKLSIVGCGLMGGGIAIDAARHGIGVRVYDTRPESTDDLHRRAAGVYARWVKNGRMTQEAARASLARIAPTGTLAEVGDADLIIEAIFEDLTLKRGLMAALAQHLGPDTIVATNTSALRVGAIAEDLTFADRVLGLHYFSPAEVSPLVEVVRAPHTSEVAVARALTFLTETRRTPLPCADSPGFAINRFFCPYYNEAVRLVEDGLATPSEVDVVARERLGVAAGPFTVLNLIGLRVASRAMENLASLGPFYAASSELLVRADRNTPYSIADDATVPESSDLIEDRLVAALAVPALELLEEGVAGREETDRGAVMALKFERGPYALIRSYPVTRVGAAIEAICKRYQHPPPSADTIGSVLSNVD
ncbi:3-hydroxybutyryl-CoA dehydrogenase [Methylobacterium brachiatum]|uniref:3-hydroxybutyryl-CoA dehydrogenase n=1 Tax=Methylobacterium brachiatum TaxID=269660 RepID=A0AAJ1WZV4_9HYPH|nr:3-hydroxyacyl-CoA dehydrogenase [Methylobacterium brachiatum]MCB4806430.1 3-hydroxyacyl-CoA dehydrogenase [Methylobacterium brachiatum]MDQ0546675.1 3-hydroxybutyryl-CoA dehydrogenase [Methylobacterium brachiatum]